jgi:hypothetical protein
MPEFLCIITDRVEDTMELVVTPMPSLSLVKHLLEILAYSARVQDSKCSC